MRHQGNQPKKRKWNISIAIPQWLTLSAVIGGFLFLHGEISSVTQRMNVYDQRFDAMNDRFEKMHQLIYQEMKDFHGRLCKIEEGRK